MKIKRTFRSIYKSLLIAAIITLSSITQAKALEYKYCNAPDQFPSCFIALKKLKTLINPLTGKKFFDDGIHYIDGKVFVFPDLHIAEADLDNDGFKEIIVKVPELVEQLKGYFCKADYYCPHYILQDRNTGRKSSLKKIKAIGPIYTVAIGLSTDEVVGGYKSLRAYTDTDIKKFDVYQYDKKTDNYHNISPSR